MPNCDENIQSEVATHSELSSTNDNELFVVCHYHDDGDEMMILTKYIKADTSLNGKLRSQFEILSPGNISLKDSIKRMRVSNEI